MKRNWLRRLLFLLGIALIIILVAVIGFIAWLLVSGTSVQSLLGNFTSCTVGASGTAANITFTGADATAACDQLTSSSHTFYRYEGTPQGNQVCAGDYRLRNGNTIHFIVRGQGGSLLSAEMVICRSLQGG